MVQCVVIYCAGIMVCLCAMLNFSFSDSIIDKIIDWLLSISGVLFGPVLLTCNINGLIHLKAISKVCSVDGIKEDYFNYPAVALLLIFSIFSAAVTLSIAFNKSLSFATTSLQDQDSLLFKTTQAYVLYSHRLRQRSQRERR